MDTNDIQISLPASKSLSNRWLMVNYLMEGCFVLKNLSSSDDTRLMQRLLRQLRQGTDTFYYCANAGTVARFLMALLSITPGTHLLSGDERLHQRPMRDLVAALRDLGLCVLVSSDEDELPIQIIGGLPQRKRVSVQASQSSQFASALMLLGLGMPSGITVNMVGRIASRPYVDMTAGVLRQAGAQVSLSPNGHTYMVGPRPQRQGKTVVTIENDWSAASYFYTMAALCPGIRIRLRTLSLDSCQGDRVVNQLFAGLGVRSQQVRSPYRSAVRSLTLSAVAPPDKHFAYNFNDCPDLLPTLAVACAALGVDAHLRGIRNLRLKETDRVNAVAAELSRMGCRVEVNDDAMHLLPSELRPVEQVRTHGDHRMVMAFAPLQLRFPDLRFDHPEVVSKSFPDFWEQFQKVRQWVDSKSVISHEPASR